MISNFKYVMDQAGLSTKGKIIPDGRMHRFTVQGDKSGSKNGWYVLYSDSVPAGSFGSWRTGEKYTWCAKSTNELTQAERAENKRRMEASRQAREAECQARRKAARDKALYIWKAATVAPDNHPYLVSKGIKNHGLKLYKDSLIIPLRDSAGLLHSLQFIDGEGNKRFLSGGKVKGCYYSIGIPEDTICIAEGFATASSVFEATRHAVAVAFNATNLEPVAHIIRAKFPYAEICLCADNDVTTEGNPGLTKAREAAASVGGILTVAGGVSC